MTVTDPPTQDTEPFESEQHRVERAYQSRQEKGWYKRYSLYREESLQMYQERERVLLSMLKGTVGELGDKRILDIGCGSGSTLLPFLLYGAKPENCFGVDIQQSRIDAAKRLLPAATFACCSAENIPFEKGTFNLVTMFTCLSSVLDDDIRRRICHEALAMAAPQKWVLIYDFRVNNPLNPDVRAVTLKELKRCFHGCKCYSQTLTLLPQLGRLIGPYSMSLGSLLARIPLLRTHRMTMFQKAGGEERLQL